MRMEKGGIVKRLILAFAACPMLLAAGACMSRPHPKIPTTDSVSLLTDLPSAIRISAVLEFYVKRIVPGSYARNQYTNEIVIGAQPQTQTTLHSIAKHLYLTKNDSSLVVTPDRLTTIEPSSYLHEAELSLLGQSSKSVIIRCITKTYATEHIIEKEVEVPLHTDFSMTFKLDITDDTKRKVELTISNNRNP